MATQGSSAGESAQFSSSKDPVSSVLLTLPITCQICLGKVKDPVICPNQHVFCGVCMTQWLNSNQICPTCRIPIDENHPCKRIIGSLDCSHPSPDKDVKEQLRRTRFELLFQEYEGEIAALETQLDEATSENRRLSKTAHDLSKKLEESEERFLRAINTGCSSKEKTNGDAVSTDINTILKLSSKLQDLIQFNNRLKEENDSLKEEIETLEVDKSKLADQVKKLVEEATFPRSPHKYGKYTVAALQTKVDNYEKEIQRLKRALDRSDEYIDQLNSELREERSRSIDLRKSSTTERVGGEDTRRETMAVHSNGHLANGQPHFGVRRQINLTMGKSPLNHVATGAFTPSSGAFTEKPPTSSCYGLSGNVDEGGLISGRNDKGDHDTTTSSCSESADPRVTLPSVFTGPPVSLSPDQASQVENLESDGGPDSFADPVRFPACAKLIQLTKAHRMLSSGSNGRIKANSDSTSATSPNSSPLTSASAVTSAATTVVSPRNNLVDLLLQPRENARRDKDKRTESPDRDPLQCKGPNSSLSYGRSGESSGSSNSDKTPSPPALIPTIGETSGAFDSTESPRYDHSPPALSYCGDYNTSSRSVQSETMYVSATTLKNDPGPTASAIREPSVDVSKYGTYALSPKRIKVEPED